ELVGLGAIDQLLLALTNGQVAVAPAPVSAGVFNALGRGVPIKLVAPLATNAAGASANYVMVRQDLIESGEFQDYAHLRGRRRAKPWPGTVADYFAGLLLQRAGVAPEDVEFVEVDIPDMPAAFANRAIDVGLGNEPAATVAESQGFAVKWKSMADVRPN